MMICTLSLGGDKSPSIGFHRGPPGTLLIVRVGPGRGGAAIAGGGDAPVFGGEGGMQGERGDGEK